MTPLVKAMEGFSSDGGLLAEQLWDADDIPEHELFFGKPAGSAMPLCWAHAEFISLVRSQKDGKCLDRIEPVHRRYAHDRHTSDLEMWTFAHQLQRIGQGKTLRIICESAGSIHWSTDHWESQQDTTMHMNSLGLYYADLPAEKLAGDSVVTFTFHWDQGDHWEEKNYEVRVKQE